MKTGSYRLEDSLGYIIGRAGRALANRLNHNFEQAGHRVTCEQWAILANLRHKNEQSQKDLAGMACKDKTSITRLIDGLEKRRLVVRVPGKVDGRQKLICLTLSGRRLQQKLIPVVQKTLQEAQDGITPQDIQICKEVLWRVAQNFNKREFDIKIS